MAVASGVGGWRTSGDLSGDQSATWQGLVNVLVDETTKRLEIGQRKVPMPYAEAARAAAEGATSDSENYGRRVSFKPKGTTIERE